MRSCASRLPPRFSDHVGEQIIHSMVWVGRVYPPNNKPVLRDISLSFFYGAKIGVLGLNGAGQSALQEFAFSSD